MKGERQQEAKRSTGFLLQDMGNSEYGDKKTESVTCLEKLREPIRASGMRNIAFFVVNFIALKSI